MGKLADQFDGAKYINEAEVIQNFVIPFLINYLGYKNKEIIPEKNFPAVRIFWGRKSFSSKDLPVNQRPDHIVCIADHSNPKFVLESKDPSENLEDHLPQLKSYALGVEVNLLVITNGIAFRIYDVNHLIFEAKNIKELDTKLDLLKEILSKDALIKKSTIEIIQSVDTTLTLNKTPTEIQNEEKDKIKLEISDCNIYIKNLLVDFSDWQIPREFKALKNLGFLQYPPDDLFRFTIDGEDSSKTNLTLKDLEEKYKSKIITYIGESGMGKSSLLKYLALTYAKKCSDLSNNEIPLYIPLRNISANKGLKDLIIETLQNKGVSLTKDEILDLLPKRHFVLLLDGYDEIESNLVNTFNKEFEQFLEVNTHKIFITTRPQRPPTNIETLRFYVLPLGKEQKENLADLYLGHNKYRFIYEADLSNFSEEMTNTFMLILLLIHYKEKQCLPQSSNKIIRFIIEKIKAWEKAKGEKTPINDWEIRDLFLSSLANKILITKSGLSLVKKDVEESIASDIVELEKQKLIGSGIDIKSIKDDLCASGLISYESDRLIFLHRLFVDYYASKKNAQIYLQDPKRIQTHLLTPDWEQVIIGVSSELDDATAFIKLLAEKNFILSAKALVEAKSVDKAIIMHAVEELKIRCKSNISAIRKSSLHILQQLELKHTKDTLYELLKETSYIDVKKICLEQIAKERSEVAKSKVLEYLNWSEGNPYDGSSEGSVAKALANFGLEENKKIIDIWRRKPDIFTTRDCHDALLSIEIEGRMSDELADEILNFFLEVGDVHKHSKDFELKDLLTRIHRKHFPSRLIEAFKNAKKEEIMRPNQIADILASYTDPGVTKLLLTNALDKNAHLDIRRGCANALVDSQAEIKLEVFLELIDEKDDWLKRAGIQGLNRFRGENILPHLLKHVKDADFFQSIVYQILADKGLIISLLTVGGFYKYIGRSSFMILLRSIRKYRYYEFLPFLNFLQKHLAEPRLHVDLAHTLYILGEKTEAREIIDPLLVLEPSDSYTLVDIAEIMPDFDVDYALKVFQKIIEHSKKNDWSNYLQNETIEAIEKIPDKRMISLLKDIAITGAQAKDLMDIERSLRALNLIATQEEENWYISFIESYPSVERWALRRAIEGLGIIGSLKSIPIIKKNITKFSDDNFVDTCYDSIRNIYRREGKNIELTEKEFTS